MFFNFPRFSVNIYSHATLFGDILEISRKRDNKGGKDISQVKTSAQRNQQNKTAGSNNEQWIKKSFTKQTGVHEFPTT